MATDRIYSQLRERVRGDAQTRYGITRPTQVQANVLSLVLFQLDTKKVKLQLWTVLSLIIHVTMSSNLIRTLRALFFTNHCVGL